MDAQPGQAGGLGRRAVALTRDTSVSANFPAIAANLQQALTETFQPERFDHLVNNPGEGRHATIMETTH